MNKQTAEKASDKKNEQVTVQKAILSYPHFTEPHKATPTSEPRFGAEIRIPKTDTVAIKKIQDLIDGIKKSKEKDKIRVFDSDICFKDGDTWEKRKPEHAGFMLLSSNKSLKQGPPDLLGRQKSAGYLPNKTAEDKADIEKKFYPGCVVNAVVSIYFSSKGGNKICSTLEVVQWWEDGDRLGGGGGASLDDLPDDDTDDNLDEEEEDPSLR